MQIKRGAGMEDGLLVGWMNGLLDCFFVVELMLSSAPGKFASALLSEATVC